MTNRQAQLLAFLRERTLAGEVCPSLDEMCSHLGLVSKGQMSRLLAKLEMHGKIIRRPYRARSIEIVGWSEYERGFRDGVASEKQQQVAA